MSEEEHLPLPPPQYGLGDIFSAVLVVSAVGLGIILILIGHIVLVTAGTSSDAYKTYYILNSLGGMISSGALVGGGILNKNIDKFVRLGMIIAAALIIVQMMGAVSLSQLY